MDNTTNTLAEQSKLRRLVNSYGVPRLIITGFLLLMFILAPVAGVEVDVQRRHLGFLRLFQRGCYMRTPRAARARS